MARRELTPEEIKQYGLENAEVAPKLREMTPAELAEHGLGPAEPQTGALGAFASSFGNAAMPGNGNGDVAGAALQAHASMPDASSPADLEKTYRQALSENQALSAAGEKQHPYASGIGQAAGTAAGFLADPLTALSSMALAGKGASIASKFGPGVGSWLARQALKAGVGIGAGTVGEALKGQSPGQMVQSIPMKALYGAAPTLTSAAMLGKGLYDAERKKGPLEAGDIANIAGNAAGVVGGGIHAVAQRAPQLAQSATNATAKALGMGPRELNAQEMTPADGQRIAQTIAEKKVVPWRGTAADTRARLGPAKEQVGQSLSDNRAAVQQQLSPEQLDSLNPINLAREIHDQGAAGMSLPSGAPNPAMADYAGPLDHIVRNMLGVQEQHQGPMSLEDLAKTKGTYGDEAYKARNQANPEPKAVFANRAGAEALQGRENRLGVEVGSPEAQQWLKDKQAYGDLTDADRFLKKRLPNSQGEASSLPTSKAGLLEWLKNSVVPGDNFKARARGLAADLAKRTGIPSFERPPAPPERPPMRLGPPTGSSPSLTGPLDEPPPETPPEPPREPTRQTRIRPAGEGTAVVSRTPQPSDPIRPDPGYTPEEQQRIDHVLRTGDWLMSELQKARAAREAAAAAQVQASPEGSFITPQPVEPAAFESTDPRGTRKLRIVDLLKEKDKEK